MPSKLHKILSSTLLSLAVGVAACVGVWFILLHFDPAGTLSEELQLALSSNVRALSSTLAQIAATMAGFILAALALILSLSSHALIKNMSASGHFHMLVLRLKVSLILCLLLTAAGLALIVIPHVGARELYFLVCSSLLVALSILDSLLKFGMVLFFLSPLPNEAVDDNAPVLYQDR